MYCCCVFPSARVVVLVQQVFGKIDARPRTVYDYTRCCLKYIYEKPERLRTVYETDAKYPFV